MTKSAAARVPRADAVRNRQLLLSTAAETFAKQGTEVSIAEIAARAGIGKGTVFRHFATKEDLIAAIAGEMIDRLVTTAKGLSDAADPAGGLLEFMTTAIELLARDRAFCDVVARPSLQHPDVHAGIEQLCEVVETLTDRARRQGAIRQDITGRDVVLLLGGVHQTAVPVEDTQPQLWRRYLGLIFDGMRAQAAPPLPYPPPSRFEFTGRWSIPADPGTAR